MAKGQSTSDARAGRRGTRERLNPTRASAGTSLRQGSLTAGVSTSALDDSRFHPLERILEGERGRLADAQSVLACLHVALLHADERRVRSDPDYAGAAAIALDLIKETAERLDAAVVRPLLSKASDRGSRRSSTPRD
jgi:hypothetical protein